MHNHTGCICFAFLQCVSSNVSSKHLDKRMHNHTSCICLTFHRCVFSYVPSICFHKQMYNHTDCIFPRDQFLSLSSHMKLLWHLHPNHMVADFDPYWISQFLGGIVEVGFNLSVPEQCLLCTDFFLSDNFVLARKSESSNFRKTSFENQIQPSYRPHIPVISYYYYAHNFIIQ